MENESLAKVIALFRTTCPMPTQVSQTQAAEMLGLSRQTVSKLVKQGTLKLNKCGMIPTELVLSARDAA